MREVEANPHDATLSSLRQVMLVPGAVAVDVLDQLTETRVWSVSAERDGDSDGAVTRILRAATALIAATDPGDDGPEVVVVTATRFHIARYLGAGVDRRQTGSGRRFVALVTLDRPIANLAAARRVFATLVAAHDEPAVDGPAVTPPPPDAAPVGPSGLPRRVPRVDTRPPPVATVGRPVSTAVLDRILDALHGL